MSAKKEVKNDVTVVETKPSALSVLGDDIAFDSQGASGFENVKADDISIPFIKILQALSPQCRGATKLPGAVEGDFFNTVNEQIYKDQIIVVPCVFQKAYVEWVPRDAGGGFVKQYFDSEILKQTTKNEKKADVLSNGNHIVTTAYHYCLLIKEDGSSERVVFALTSTQLKKSRKWLSQMMSLQITIGDKKVTPPMYSHTYPVTSREESNDFGSWYGFMFGNPTMIQNKGLYAEAKKFYHDVTAGIVKTAEPPVDNEGPAPVTTDDVENHM